MVKICQMAPLSALPKIKFKCPAGELYEKQPLLCEKSVNSFQKWEIRLRQKCTKMLYFHAKKLKTFSGVRSQPPLQTYHTGKGNTHSSDLTPLYVCGASSAASTPSTSRPYTGPLLINATSPLWSVPEIFGITVESCQKSRKIFAVTSFFGGSIVKIMPILSQLTSTAKNVVWIILLARNLLRLSSVSSRHLLGESNKGNENSLHAEDADKIYSAIRNRLNLYILLDS